MNFKIFGDAVNSQLEKMSNGELFTVDISKDELWDTYLKSFPEGTNPIFRERTEHDCQCCKQFIRACGNVVGVVDGKLTSIWEINIGGHYQEVANALHTAVMGRYISNVFMHYETKLGTEHSFDAKDPQNIIKWDHFNYTLKKQFVMKNADIASHLGNKRANKEVFERSILELTIESAETILELIEQNSLYRGEEHRSIVEAFVRLKKEYAKLKTVAARDLFFWQKSLAMGGAAKIRNTVIGTLMADISSGMDIDEAVKAFEFKVAPQNYKRPTALITQAMIKKAQEKVAELGIESSLARRYAVMDDVTINNVIFANREAKKTMGESVFDQMSKQVKVDAKKFDKVEEITIENFVENVLPKAVKLELFVENKHTNNFMSVIAPVNADAPNILKWDNNFSWAYNGEVTDSMKERVKAKGGNVTGDLRFSIQWNEKRDNGDDLDAHCIEPTGYLIYFGNRGRPHPSSGTLDVDIINPGRDIAVENITWAHRSKMPKGEYQMIVHCYSSRMAKSGFDAQIEFDGVIHDFHYPKPLKGGQKVHVASVKWDGVLFTLMPKLESSASSKTVWGVNTQNFSPVSLVMQSPNHWDGQTNGNKHWFFILDQCRNGEQARGLFNEFLKPELNEHRKVFEVLGSKMKTEKSDDQLSGVGFSSTQRNSVLCRVTSNNINRVVKITF